MKFFAVLSILFLLTNAVYSHLDGGEDLAFSGGYTIDFGFSPVNPKITDSVTIAFNLFNSSNMDAIEPESVWVRISSADEVIFSGTFHPEFKNVIFSYNFQNAGEYEILARFNGENSRIAEATFMLEVGESKKIAIFKNFILCFVNLWACLSPLKVLMGVG